MPTGPDARYYVHASARAAKAEQKYFVEIGSPKPPRGTRTPEMLFDWRVDWWIPILIASLLAVAVALAAFVG